MTQSGQVTLFDWDETVLGQIPASPTGRAIRFVSENLRVLPTLVDSPEITAGNEPQDSVLNGYEGGGDLQIAFSPRNYDRYMENLYWGSFAAPAGSASTPVRSTGTAQVTYTASTRTLATAGTWTNTPVPGDKILVQGSGNAYLDGIHTVDPTSTPTATAIVLEQDGILSNTAKVPDIGTARNITIIRCERLTNSLTPDIQSLGIEKRVTRTRGSYLGTDASSVSPTVDYSQFLALLAQRFQLQATGDSPWTGQISLRASQEINSSDADGVSDTVLSSTTAWDDTPIFQGINSVKKCRFYFPSISGTAGDAGKIEDTLRLCPQSLSVEMANNLQVTPLMCAAPEFDYQPGEPLMQVVVSGIYETPYPIVAFNQQYDGVFELALVATNGDGYLFRMPRAKLTLARADTPGRAQTISVSMTVKAFRQITPVAGDSARAVEIYRFRQP
jgi:hypothetical protein